MVTADIAAPYACPLPLTPTSSEEDVGQQVIDMLALRQIRGVIMPPACRLVSRACGYACRHTLVAAMLIGGGMCGQQSDFVLGLQRGISSSFSVRMLVLNDGTASLITIFTCPHLV